MYTPEQWSMCFPALFPYGDGVFGLPRDAPLTFQQCVGMHLLREELSYEVTEDMLAEAHVSSARGESEGAGPAADAHNDGSNGRSRRRAAVPMLAVPGAHGTLQAALAAALGRRPGLALQLLRLHAPHGADPEGAGPRVTTWLP